MGFFDLFKTEGTTCPKCSVGKMRVRGEKTEGFNAGNAIVGAMLFGPIGAAAGGSAGNKKKIYVCDKCGYTIEEKV